MLNKNINFNKNDTESNTQRQTLTNGVFFHDHSQITGLQGKGEGISLTPHYHFHPPHRHLGISRVITAESSTLHIGSSRTQTSNICFPSASRQPLSFSSSKNRKLKVKLWRVGSRQRKKKVLFVLFILSEGIFFTFLHYLNA